jgi:Zn-dependent protease
MIVIISVYIHSLAHGVAEHNQLEVDSNTANHLSFNPVYYLNYISLILLVLFGFFWDSFQLSSTRLKHKYSQALISFAGPFASLVMVFVFSLFYVLFYKANLTFLPVHVKKNLLFACQLGSQANALMALFTFIPLPPLDGSKVAEFLFPFLKKYYDKIGDMGYLILFILILIIPGISQQIWQMANFISAVALGTMSSIF